MTQATITGVGPAGAKRQAVIAGRADRRGGARAALLGLVLLAPVPFVLAGPAVAQAAQGDPGQGTGPLPTNVAPTPAPICTDRPTKANVACTVPAGNLQIESDILNWTRMTDAGTRTDTILYTNPTLKYGLGTHTDVEVNLAPYETVRTTPTAGGAGDTRGGVGDLYVRIKQRLTADAAKTQVSLIPLVKAPTSPDGIGNGRWEGGLTSAVNIPLPAHFTLTFGPEVDILANDKGGNYHPALVSLVNLSHPVGKQVNVYAEFWNQQELAPGGTVHQYSADVALSYQLNRTFQLDLGGNVGLNHATPGVQLYVGASRRF